MIEIFLIALSFFLFLFLSLKNIYHFQITEYRWDRLRAMLNDIGYFKFFDFKIVFPAKTIRNILIFFFSFSFLFIINLLLFNIIEIYLLFLLNYIFSKISTILGVICSIPFASYHRRKTILKAKKLAKNSNTVFIGITGSFGKSSVKEFLYEFLKTKYSVQKTSGNRNTNIGVSMEVVEKMKRRPKFFIIEMGAYKIGEIEAICDIVKPKYGILTGIGNQHMDIFGSLENLVYAKSELVSSLPEDGIAVVNIETGFEEDIFKNVKARKITYGKKENSDFRIVEINYRKRLTFVKFEKDSKEYIFTTALLGKHHVFNLIGSVALALELGISYDDIVKAIAKIEPMPGKLSLHTGLNGSAIFNDGYNSNLHGFLSALDVLKSFDAEKKYVFSYGMFELGKERKEAYKKVVEKLDEYNIVLFTLDSKFTKFGSKNVFLKKSEKEVLDFLKKNLSKKDILLLQGRCSEDFLNSLDLKKYGIQD